MLRLDPCNVHAYHNRGISYDKTGAFEKVNPMRLKDWHRLGVDRGMAAARHEPAGATCRSVPGASTIHS